MHPAQLWESIADNRCHCRLCRHFCLIDEGETGKCGVRINQDGKLFTLVYDRVAAVNMDPVEKKPLYHFLPGTLTFSFGTMGCNFGCVFCQNDSLSQPPRSGRTPAGHHTTPEALVQAALDGGAASISYTYSEPTVFFEIMLETAKLAHANGLKNVLVSNGFQSPQCLDALAPYIDAANIDLKSFDDTFYRERCRAALAPVLENLMTIKQLGWWLEVTTLVIPDLNDSRRELKSIATFIANELGTDTPWHLSRFHPQFQLLSKPPTPVATLEMAQGLGLEAGIEHVYVGNVPGSPASNTFCPGCKKKVIDRLGFSVLESGVVDGSCSHCGQKLPGTWK
ncbi:MAG: AmmeMemoRadiSam system radical SAM enzyme [Proteobacteria bacterium]|nr:AmmeMemoRadiSam system radical SAM enzyme [Pseudomonadota bacterium]